MDWLAWTPFLLCGIAWMMLPGLLIGAVASLRGWALVALSPVLSVFVIGTGAVLAKFSGVGWGPVPALILTVVTAAVVAVIDLIRRRVLGTVRAGHWRSGWVPWRKLLRPAAPVAAAALVMTALFVCVMVVPHQFSQSFDSIAHLSEIRRILIYGDGSSFMSPFYPNAFSDFAVLIAMSLGSANVVFAANAAVWTIIAVVWPMGAIWLLRTLLPGRSTTVQVGFGVLVALFAGSYPSLQIAEAQFPNLLGFALLPALLTAATMVLRLAGRPSSPPLSLAMVCAIGVVGLVFAHPNAILAFIACLAPMGLVWAWRGVKAAGRHLVAVAYVASALVALAVFAVVWRLSGIDYIRAPRETWWASLGDVLTISPNAELLPFWLLGALLVVGIVRAVRQPVLRWWLGPYAVVVYLWVMVSAVREGPFRHLMVGGFYCDAYRLGGLLGIVSVPLAAFGFDWLWPVLFRWLRKRHWWRGYYQQMASRIVLFAMILGVISTPGMIWDVVWMHGYYTIAPNSPLVDTDEYALLLRLPSLVPPDVRVATVPSNGSSMAFAVAGVLTTSTSMNHQATPDEDVINRFLNLVDKEPDMVCPAIRRLGVGYALDFGPKIIDYNYPIYPGFWGFAADPAFVEVARQGHAVLYRIDACD